MNDLKKLQEAALYLLKTAETKKYSVLSLAKKVAAYAEEYPEDNTLVGMASFLDKRSSKALYIERKELKEVYSRLYTTNNKCAAVLAEELDLPAAKINTKIANVNHNPESLNEVYDRYVDKDLSNALASALDKDFKYVPFDDKIAKKAEQLCLNSLNFFPTKPNDVSIIGGSKDAILISASYNTPKGKTSMIVPMEIADGKPLFPTAFVSEAGFSDLNEKNISGYIVRTAGKNNTIDSSKVLQVIKLAKNGIEAIPEMSEVESIVMRAKLAHVDVVNPAFSSKSEPEYVSGITCKADEAQVAAFSHKLAGIDGEAEFVHGKAVNAGRMLIAQKLRGFGHDGQVKVHDFGENKITYAVKLASGQAFKVPVKINKSLPELPKLALASGNVYDFSREGLNEICAVDDVSLAATTSDFHSLNSSQLIDKVEEFAANANMKGAEDALNVLAQSGDETAYKYAFERYSGYLSGKIARAGAHGCTRKIKTANSSGTICGHLNLPLNKVYVDEDGNCAPLYRKNMEHTDSRASFLANKIFMS